ncbi:hypothetical protein K457DRAFT_130753 [Linnemannia elongata AG-77]|uniref:Uncharacterized protein n=1 Tax=Linnemannia elongata AG-77 TaxID=1314771 RepID=A0A197JFE7_9FUNG|nr:hypothetical protein K457DRAFT_130753 [Linnemannia elongata AG-77]
MINFNSTEALLAVTALVSAAPKGATTPANLNITHPTILDQLKANGLTYKQYTESYPGGCYVPDMYPDDKVTALYYKCHLPFNMIFNLRDTPECLSAIGTYDDYANEVAKGTLPN